MNYFMGVDMGTSSVRAVLFDETGHQVAVDAIECSLLSSMDGRAELDPDQVVNSVVQVICGCMKKSRNGKKNIAGMGISCHMHSLMAVDASGIPLTRLLIWADTRAGREAETIARRFDVADLYQRTGCRVQHPMYPLSKILWLKDNQPEVFNKAFKFITIKDYLLFRLYGEFITDFTLAASQGYFNIHRQEWDGEILEDILGISKDRLSQPVECLHVLRGMKPEAAEMLGLDRDFPVVVGSGDGIMANLGCGVTDDTAFSSTIGTSGAVRTSLKSPFLDAGQRTWCYSFTRDTWVAGGAINNGGIVLKWLRETFRKQFEFDAAAYSENVYKMFDRFASEVNPGSDGLIFLPYLTGERSPDWNAEVRGLMVGLDFSHTRKHMIRAAMEGVLYRLFSVYEVMAGLCAHTVQIRANGGYIKSDLWLQIQADIFNKEILVCNVPETSALGAAYLSMVALGAVGDIRSLLPGMEPRRVVKPQEQNHEIYRKAYTRAKEVYRSIYPG